MNPQAKRHQVAIIGWADESLSYCGEKLVGRLQSFEGPPGSVDHDRALCSARSKHRTGHWDSVHSLRIR